MRPFNAAWNLLKQTFPNTTNDPRASDPYADPRASQRQEVMPCPSCGGSGQVPVPEQAPRPAEPYRTPLNPDESIPFETSPYQGSQTPEERYPPNAPSVR